MGCAQKCSYWGGANFLFNFYQKGNSYNFARFLYQQWAVPKNVVWGGASFLSNGYQHGN